MNVRVPAVVLGARFNILVILILSLPPLAAPLGYGATWSVYANLFGMIGMLGVYVLLLVLVKRFLGRLAPPATMPPAAALRENLQRLLGVALLIVFLPSFLTTPLTYSDMADLYAPPATQAQYFTPKAQRMWWMAYGEGWQGIFMALAGFALLVLPWRRTPPETIDAPVASQAAESAITTDEYECDACGTTVVADAIACPQCGADLTEITEAPAATRMPRVIIIFAVAVPLLSAYWLMRQAPMSQSSGPRVEEAPHHPQAIYLGRKVENITGIGIIVSSGRTRTSMLVNGEVCIEVHDGIGEDTVAMICRTLWSDPHFDHRILSICIEPAEVTARETDTSRSIRNDSQIFTYTESISYRILSSGRIVREGNRSYGTTYSVMTGERRGPLNGNGDVIRVWYADGRWHLEPSGMWVS